MKSGGRRALMVSDKGEYFWPLRGRSPMSCSEKPPFSAVNLPWRGICTRFCPPPVPPQRQSPPPQLPALCCAQRARAPLPHSRSILPSRSPLRALSAIHLVNLSPTPLSHRLPFPSPGSPHLSETLKSWLKAMGRCVCVGGSVLWLGLGETTE